MFGKIKNERLTMKEMEKKNKIKKTRGDVGKMDIVVFRPTGPEFCFTF